MTLCVYFKIVSDSIIIDGLRLGNELLWLHVSVIIRFN